MKIHQLKFSLPAAAGVVALLWLTPGCKPGSWSDDSSLAAYEEQLKAEAKARSADPAWKPATENVAVIQASGKSKGWELHSFCLNTNGHVLACWGDSAAPAKDSAAQIQVFSPDGMPVSTWPLPSTPEAICVDPDGTIFVGGAGRLLRLDQTGKVIASADSPTAAQTVALDKAALESRRGKKLSDKEFADYQKSLQQRKRNVTGIAVTGSDLFVACPSVLDFTYAVYRLDRDLKDPKLIVKGLHGCCGQMDIQARDGKLWVAHNARHLVECYDRDGKKLSSFGKTDRKAAAGFGGCCEPKNLRLAADGKIYAAESGPPVAIKRFSLDGKFSGVVAVPSFKSGCVRVTVDVSPDCKRFYILDSGANSIQVFEEKKIVAAAK